MANPDSFITEVTEEVRRDRLFALMRKYGWIAVLLVVLLVGGAAWNEWRKAGARAEAQQTGDALIAALRQETPEARTAALSDIPLSDDAGTRAISLFLQSAAALETDDAATAVEHLDAIENDPDVSPIYRDLATLKKVMASTGIVSPEDRIAMLEPLSAPGNSFRLLAIEQRAFAEVESGDRETAIETLLSILSDAEVTEDLRRRAQQLIVALGGSLDQS